MQVDICVALLAESHQVVWVERHLQALQAVELRETDSVVNVDCSRQHALLRAYLAGGMRVKVGYPHRLPLCCRVDFLPFLSFRVFGFSF